ncbi:MAG: hypothetical protein FE78DRAFT_434580 [Acidomyces sp. 'richmondensis']|nr:MAG: hypothetical protein FE78DRAFT_434580 [Acidomyces sp. 'richmondensis']
MRAENVFAVATVATLASAQGFTLNPNGTITCAIANGTYCAGEDSNIIIRCVNGVGGAGNCNDNLSGEPPIGVTFTTCYDCGATSGRAACGKNGTVYPASGSGLGDTPFPTSDLASVCSASTSSTSSPSSSTTSSASHSTSSSSSTTTSTVITTTIPFSTSLIPVSSYAGAPSSSSPASASASGSPTSSAPSSSSSVLLSNLAAGPDMEITGTGILVGIAAVFAAFGMI